VSPVATEAYLVFLGLDTTLGYRHWPWCACPLTESLFGQ